MQYINIPEELRKLNRWVCWTMEERKGKPTKVPKNPKTGGNAMSDNPDTWGSFKQAVDRSKKDNFPGIGFMFNGDGVVGVDIDGCRDKETGELSADAREIIELLDSYTEISASGKGVHIICHGSLPEGKRRHKSVEMYETLRYFIMTGDVIDDRDTIQERTDQLSIVHEKFINVRKSEENAHKNVTNEHKPREIAPNLSDDDIIEKAISAKNGDLFAKLMDGSWNSIYSSQSEADMALCNMLAFWTGRDADAMDRIFRRSGLFRDKWDEHRPDGTYGSKTIAEAIAECKEVYDPKKKERKPKNKKQDPIPEDPPEIEDGFEHLLEQVDSGNPQLPAWVFGPYNDTWNSQRLLEKHGQDIRYSTSKGYWFIWNGKYWCEDKTGQMRQKADEAIADIYEYKPAMLKIYGGDSKTYKAFNDWLRGSRNTNRKDNMLRECMCSPGIATLPDAFDSDGWLINVNNGTIDMRTGKLREHRREDLITRICPVDFDENAKAQLWEKFLERIFEGNVELIKFIQRAMGYTLTGSTREQALFVCYGTGANGKSTMLGIMQELMGEYARNTNFNTFAVRNDTNTNDIARLVGTRFVTAMEVGEDKRLNEALVKQLTGGDKISARFLHKEFFDFVPTFKIWMGVNHKPKIKETDNGIWRRIKLVPFEVTIPDKERDGELPNKLRAEFPGILAWAVRGCVEWQKIGLNPPSEVSAATDAYRGEMDVLQSFMEDCIVKKEGECIRTGELYQIYEIWCDKNGEYKMSSTKFGTKMKERGFKKSRTSIVRTWEDITFTEYANRLKFGGEDKGRNSGGKNKHNNDFTLIDGIENPFDMTS